MGYLALIAEDFRTHDRDPLRPGFWALVVHRFGAWRYGVRPRFLRAPFYLAYRLAFAAVQALTGIEIPCEVRLGRRLRIEHHSGIIVNGDATLGDDCVIRNGVTIGVRSTGVPGSPALGHRVDVGAGAKILGPVRIGNDVAVGANAVVLIDVPDWSIAVGVPAVARPRRRPAHTAGGEPAAEVSTS